MLDRVLTLRDLARAPDDPTTTTACDVLGLPRSTWHRWANTEEGDRAADPVQRARVRQGLRDWARRFGFWLYELDQRTGGPDVWGSLLDCVRWGYEDGAERAR